MMRPEPCWQQQCAHPHACVLNHLLFNRGAGLIDELIDEGMEEMAAA